MFSTFDTGPGWSNMSFSLFIIIYWSVSSKEEKIRLPPKKTFFYSEKIYLMIPISIYKSNVEKTGPDWSGPVVQVAYSGQKNESRLLKWIHKDEKAAVAIFFRCLCAKFLQFY